MRETKKCPVIQHDFVLPKNVQSPPIDFVDCKTVSWIGLQPFISKVTWEFSVLLRKNTEWVLDFWIQDTVLSCHYLTTQKKLFQLLIIICIFLWIWEERAVSIFQHLSTWQYSFLDMWTSLSGKKGILKTRERWGCSCETGYYEVNWIQTEKFNCTGQQNMPQRLQRHRKHLFDA